MKSSKSVLFLLCAALLPLMLSSCGMEWNPDIAATIEGHLQRGLNRGTKEKAEETGGEEEAPNEGSE